MTRILGIISLRLLTQSVPRRELLYRMLEQDQRHMQFTMLLNPGGVDLMNHLTMDVFKAIEWYQVHTWPRTICKMTVTTPDASALSKRINQGKYPDLILTFGNMAEAAMREVQAFYQHVDSRYLMSGPAPLDLSYREHYKQFCGAVQERVKELTAGMPTLPVRVNPGATSEQ